MALIRVGTIYCFWFVKT